MASSLLFGVLSTALVILALLAAWRRAHGAYRIVPYGLTLWSVAMLPAILGWAKDQWTSNADVATAIGGVMFVFLTLGISISLLLLASGVVIGLRNIVPSSLRWLALVATIPVFIVWIFSSYLATILGISELVGVCLALMDGPNCDIWAG